MDVTCDRCNAEYEFDEALLGERGTTVKCSACGHVFRVLPPNQGAGRAPLQLRYASDGSVRELSSLRELQQRIRHGEVSLDDELGRDGFPFRALRQIPELKNFFLGKPGREERTTLRPEGSLAAPLPRHDSATRMPVAPESLSPGPDSDPPDLSTTPPPLPGSPERMASDAARARRAADARALAERALEEQRAVNRTVGGMGGAPPESRQRNFGQGTMMGVGPDGVQVPPPPRVPQFGSKPAPTTRSATAGHTPQPTPIPASATPAPSAKPPTPGTATPSTSGTAKPSTPGTGPHQTLHGMVGRGPERASGTPRSGETPTGTVMGMPPAAARPSPRVTLSTSTHPMANRVAKGEGPVAPPSGEIAREATPRPVAAPHSTTHSASSYSASPQPASSHAGPQGASPHSASSHAARPAASSQAAPPPSASQTASGYAAPRAASPQAASQTASSHGAPQAASPTQRPVTSQGTAPVSAPPQATDVPLPKPSTEPERFPSFKAVPTSAQPGDPTRAPVRKLYLDASERPPPRATEGSNGWLYAGLIVLALAGGGWFGMTRLRVSGKAVANLGQEPAASPTSEPPLAAAEPAMAAPSTAAPAAADPSGAVPAADEPAALEPSSEPAPAPRKPAPFAPPVAEIEEELARRTGERVAKPEGQAKPAADDDEPSAASPNKPEKTSEKPPAPADKGPVKNDKLSRAERAVAANPQDYGAQLNRADALFARGDNGAAIDAYKTALTLRPAGSEANSGLGFALLKEGKASDSLPYFDRAASSGYAEANIGLGDAYRALGQSSSAKEAYQAYLDRLPGGSRAEYARNQLDKLSGGGAKERPSSAPEAYRPAGELSEPTPANPEPPAPSP